MADTSIDYLDGTGSHLSQAIDRIAGVDTVYVGHRWGPSGTKNDTDTAIGKALPSLPGLSSCTRVVCAASTNATNIKSSAGFLRGFIASNSLGSGFWLKFHNVAGAPTPGAGVVRAFFVNAGLTVPCSFPAAINFTTGIAITTISDSAGTGGVDSDTTALATANKVILEIFYE